MSKIKQLAGDTALYGLGSMVPRMLNFLLLPIHTKNAFSPEQYSAITQLMAIVGVLNVVYMFGMETAFFRFSSKPGADPKRIYNLTQTSVFIISTVLSLFIIAFSLPLADSLQVNPQYIIWLTLVLFIDAVVAIPFARLRLQRKPLLFATAKIINVLILIGLNIYFLKWNKANYDPEIGVGYVFIANLIANSFYLLFLLKSLREWRPAIDKEVLSSMIKYSYPIMITGVAGMINEMFSRLTLEWWLPENFYPGKSVKAALGIFGACYKYAVFMSLGVQAFRFAAEPFFFSNASDKNSPALFARINHYFVIVCCIFLFGVSTNLDILKEFMDKEYWEGLSIVPILLLGYLFLGIYYNFSVWFKLTDKTQYGTYIAVGGAMLTIALNYILIPIWGYMGSSVVTFVCYFSMTAACYWTGQKHYPIPYKIGKGLLYISITLGLAYLVNSLNFSNQWSATAMHALFLMLFVFIVYIIEKKGLREAFS